MVFTADALFDRRNVPSAAPPIMIISNGAASRITSSLPPWMAKPPNTMTKMTTMPISPNIATLRCLRPDPDRHALRNPSQFFGTPALRAAIRSETE